jgi:hypothetical protein
MTLNELATAAVVPAVTVWDYEAGFGHPSEANLAAIQAALERAGVEFIPDGVKLGKGAKRRGNP